MKESLDCNIAQDLLTLYVEELCSEESKSRLEQHLASCPECAKKLEHYQKEIEGDKEEGQKELATENDRDLKPMKKVRKKLTRRKRVAMILGTMLTVLLLCIGYLSYGEMTNHCLSFSALADIVKLKHACKELTKGNTEELVDMIAFSIEGLVEQGFVGLEEYQQIIKKNMEEAYEYHFKGKDIRVKYSHHFQVGYDALRTAEEYTSIFVFHFYEEDELVYNLTFGKCGENKFEISETSEINQDEPRFAAQMLPYDESMMEIALKHAIRTQYENRENIEDGSAPGGAALTIIVETMGTEEEKIAYRQRRQEKLDKLYEDGWCIKDTMFSVDRLDTDAGRWIYKVWFEMVNTEDGATCILEHYFYYYGDKLYALEDDSENILAVNGTVPENIREQMLVLFE